MTLRVVQPGHTCCICGRTGDVGMKPGRKPDEWLCVSAWECFGGLLKPFLKPRPEAGKAMTWEIQGIHEFSSNVEVRVVDQVPAAMACRDDRAIRIECAASSAFLFPEQARHLASVLVEAADFAEAGER